MKATYAQYLRIEAKAGGVHASPRAVIKASHTLLSPTARHGGYLVKTLRHEWLRSVLSHHQRAQAIHSAATGR